MTQLTPCRLATNLGELPIRLATPDDVTQLMHLFREVRQWLCALDLSKEWDWIDSPDLAAYLHRWVTEHAVYIVVADERIVATVTLDEDDEKMWSARGLDGRALYLKKMATSRILAGRGIGARLIAFSADMARVTGRDLLRLDCLADDRALCAYYERMEFTYAGETYLEYRDWRAALYERPVRA